MKHTQGPWKVRENFDIKNDQPVFEIDSESAGIDCVATIWTALDKGDIVTDEFTANAHLIAAAPDLLSCVQDAVSDLWQHMTAGQLAHFQSVLSKADGGGINDMPPSVGGGYNHAEEEKFD